MADPVYHSYVEDLVEHLALSSVNKVKQQQYLKTLYQRLEKDNLQISMFRILVTNTTLCCWVGGALRFTRYIQSVKCIHQYFGFFGKGLSVSKFQSWDRFQMKALIILHYTGCTSEEFALGFFLILGLYLVYKIVKFGDGTIICKLSHAQNIISLTSNLF